MPKVQINNLKVSYGRLHRRAVLNIEQFEIKEGEILVIFGPNHSGKSTLLKVLARALRGLHVDKSSRLLYDGKPLTEFGRHNISYLPQGFAATLFPWMSVADNLRLRLMARPVINAARLDQVSELCQSLQYTSEDDLYKRLGFFDNGVLKMPTHLSGGQQQRLALLRALLPTPKVLLLDEPFSALDAFEGVRFRSAILQRIESSNITTILVTHDLEEAVNVADRIVILKKLDTELGSTFANEYIVGTPRPGSNLDSKEARELVEKIRRENGIQ